MKHLNSGRRSRADVQSIDRNNDRRSRSGGEAGDRRPDMILLMNNRLCHISLHPHVRTILK